MKILKMKDVVQYLTLDDRFVHLSDETDWEQEIIKEILEQLEINYDDDQNHVVIFATALQMTDLISFIVRKSRRCHETEQPNF